MAAKFSKKWIVIAIVVVVGGILAYKYWKSTQSALPAGIVSGNGRLEAKLSDASAKEPLRVKEVLVDEGDLVKPGQVLVRLDTVTIEAELAKNEAGVAGAREEFTAAKAAITMRPRPARSARISMTPSVAARTRTETAIAENASNAPLIQRTTRTMLLGATRGLSEASTLRNGSGKASPDVHHVIRRRVGSPAGPAQRRRALRTPHRPRRFWESDRVAPSDAARWRPVALGRCQRA